MSSTISGQKVKHAELGEGVVLGSEPSGFVNVFFRQYGERSVPADSLRQALSWNEQVVSGLKPAESLNLQRLWLAIEAVELPLLESASTLTSAKVDLLPHQVVLVHRVANASPRRFLVADEVGLGKTIETALILRELASRGELERALMVVPAGLVDNWRRELNEVFNLDFEVFGYEGDVTDRKSNAFAKHNRLIVSVDTLKRRTRVRRLLAAPPWDLVVFDEAHHLSVYKTGKKTKKTENFKLAEDLKGHCRDLLLLSATPHQGDHFRFWALIRLLDPALFTDEQDMLQNRHRLNSVVARRTKADACQADGSPLFARRVVHTQTFTLSAPERDFYDALLEYLRDGYDLASQQGNKGRALGFVMTIFQKIAASSFAAVKATLQRRLLMLTIHEAIERDELLDADGRDRVYAEARILIHHVHELPDDAIGRAQVDQILADSKVQLLRKRKGERALVESAESYDDSEAAAATGEDSATMLAANALPEERLRIHQLLERFPQGQETKTRVLLHALDAMWKVNPDEKLVIFTTYLGSIASIHAAIDKAFPGKGVEVLKGGDHGAKVAAQRRFKRPDGPHVLLCTAAGREGINLQFARVLFNYDLPWNPMDLEQRIGRIHRYGQVHTAQVYNLVAADTIEGQIYLLLEEKLKGIGQALGKVDDNGEVAEDLRAQVLGQLSSQLSYDKLYQEALQDPTLTRTRQELEVAMTNADRAREIVFELFQDLDRFDLSDYKEMEDEGRGMQRLLDFVKRAAAMEGGKVESKYDGDSFVLHRNGKEDLAFTTNREKALDTDKLDLLGLEHPAVKDWLTTFQNLDATNRALIGTLPDSDLEGILTFWHVTVHASEGRVTQKVIRLGFTPQGDRLPALEQLNGQLLSLKPSKAQTPNDLHKLITKQAPETLHRELKYAGLLPDSATYSSKLLGQVLIATPARDTEDGSLS